MATETVIKMLDDSTAEKQEKAKKDQRRKAREVEKDEAGDWKIERTPEQQKELEAWNRKLSQGLSQSEIEARKKLDQALKEANDQSNRAEDPEEAMFAEAREAAAVDDPKQKRHVRFSSDIQTKRF